VVQRVRRQGGAIVHNIIRGGVTVPQGLKELVKLQKVAGVVRSVGPAVRFSERWFASLLILPAFLVISLVVVFPLVYSLWMSFADVNLLRTTGPALDLFGVSIPLFRLRRRSELRPAPRRSPLLGLVLADGVLRRRLRPRKPRWSGLGMALVLQERFLGRPVMRSLLLIPWRFPHRRGAPLDRTSRRRVRP